MIDRRLRFGIAQNGLRHRLFAGAAALCACIAFSSSVRAQGSAALGGRVLDDGDGAPVAGATLVLRALTRDAVAPGGTRTSITDDGGAYRFGDLSYGRYRLSVERLGYRAVALIVSLEREPALALDIRLEPLPFPLDPLSLHSSVSPFAQPTASVPPDASVRIVGERSRQHGDLSTDVRRLTPADVRASNTLFEEDLFRALQRTPGIATRDDFSADLWTRGGSAGQTVLLFDGIPLIGGLHALGILSGPMVDMLADATLHPGVAGAPIGGGGAGVVEVTTRSPLNAPRATTVGLSPVSARVSTDGVAAGRVAWAIGARRSHVDALSLVADPLTPGAGRVPYAFTDVTTRVDVALSSATRFEVSAFWQDDRVYGDIEELARGNEGEWGARMARTTFVADLGGVEMRHTVGASAFDASLRAEPGPSTLHPPTENHYRTIVWESRVDGGSTTEPWSAGVRASREDHRYSGPGIDLASLLSPDDLARRGIGDLIPVILGLERAYLLEHSAMTRVAGWGQKRMRLVEGLHAEAGLRVESGDRVAGGAVRLAPRLQLRYRVAPPLAISAAYGRAFQYVQSVARTDVLRSGLRASEVLVQAGLDSPALRSDVVTLGAELSAGPEWRFGATAWQRTSDGILVPLPDPGAIDGPRPAVPATGRARGAELSARRLAGRVRGFANYSLSHARYAAGAFAFDAPEDRRHVANLGIVADVRPTVTIGATVRAESGAPYTRITLIETPCSPPLPCGDAARVLFGTPGGQRASAFHSVDLMAEWTRAFDGWSLDVYGQVRNALGSGNAVSYHSSCVCVSDGVGASLTLGDRFDRGLPRLPVLGVRARF